MLLLSEWNPIFVSNRQKHCCQSNNWLKVIQNTFTVLHSEGNNENSEDNYASVYGLQNEDDENNTDRVNCW
jgi:hypothetical protein